MIGAMRERVEIQRREIEASDLGEPVASWRPLATVWARVEPLSASEIFRASQVQSSTSLRVVVRYLPSLAVTDRFLWRSHAGDLVLEIQSVLDLGGRGRFHECLCTLAGAQS